MHVDTNLVAALKTALEALSNPDIPADQRKSHENALLAFRREDTAWSTALSLVDQGQAHDLVLFASQTIRFKVNEQASSLAADQVPHLLQQVIHHLAKPQLHSQVLRQLCLAATALIALMPMWSEAVEIASQLPKLNGSELLTIIAEEGISDWRHIVIAGFSSSQQLDWATATRERFRSWSHPVLQGVLCWLQDCRQGSNANAELLVKLLSCLTAWVRLGALHHVPHSLAMQVAEAGLICIQTRDEQELESSLNLLLEIPEYATEQLLAALQPSMVEVAEAACRAANAPQPDLVHAAAWTRVFAAYAAALPQQLLQPLDAAGGAVQKALLHVSTLPQIRDGTLVCLPALEVWASLLERDNTLLPAPISTSTVATGAAGGGKVDLERAQSEGETVGDLKQLPAAFTRSCLVLLLCTACNWLQWQQCSQGWEATAEEGTAAVVQDILQMACAALGPEKYVAAMMLVWGVGQQQQQPDAPQQHPHHGNHQHQQTASRAFLEAFHLPRCAPLLELADYELMPAWQQQQLSRVLACISLSPACLRLHAAVLLAASSCTVRGAAAAVEAEGEPGSQWPDTPAQLQKCNFLGAGQLAQMLSAAAAALQHPVPAGILPEQQQQLALNFCVAVKGWARLLVELFTSPTMPDGAAHMSGLLQLLLNLAAHNETAACSAAAAIRAVSSAALKLGWSQLHLFAPLLLQALHAVTFSCGAEQDLLASLSSCLAAPGVEEELQALRHSVAQQLLQPGVAFLASLQQQLQAGVPWASLASTADSQICQHLIRVRAVLEGRLLLQERQQKEQQQRQRLEQELEACVIGNSFDSIDRRLQALHVLDSHTAGATNVLAGRLAAAAMDEDGLEGAVASLHNSSSSPGPDMRQQRSRAQELQQQQHNDSDAPLWGTLGGAAAATATAAAAAAAATAGDPALQVLLTQVWPQLHSLVAHHNASGKFLHHYSKCCSRLLKIHPALLVPQLQQFLQVAVVSIAKPGGGSLAEPFAAAIEACCMQGSSLLLESGPQITQALSELWSVQELAALQQPGGGDAVPDLAEQVLKLYSSFAKHGRILHSHGAAAGILQQATAAAASCATCCHRKLGSAALSLLSAVLAAASCEGPQQQQLLDVVCEQGVAIIQGVVGALLTPSPLSRVQKATAVLLDLAAAVDQMQDCGSGSGVTAAAAAARSTWQYQQQHGQLQLRSANEQQQCQVMYNWLLQGALKYVPGTISQAEAAALAADCATLLCGSSGKGGMGSGSRQAQHASRSFITVRKLKKRLREFAEKHMRAVAGTSADRAGVL